MQRDLQTMASSSFDLVVVGGGISGACIARDAALRGLSVALVERGDFAQGTTAASSKLIHGGLRYLKKLELSLVRESLRERRIWEVVAPHMVHPLPTMIPAYRRSGSPSKFMLRAGLTLYDLLAYDRNRLEDEDKKLPAHRTLGAQEALRAEPSLPREDLVGALVYYDCQMHCPERLCLEVLLDAAAHGARLANYAEVTGFVLQGGAVTGIEVRDAASGDTFAVRGRLTINASGPWADRLLGRLPGARPQASLVRSKGIHVITRALTREHAVVVEHQGAHFFLLPWRGHSLIGTTDTVFSGDPDAFAVTEADIVSFLATINAGYPTVALDRGDVRWFYGGMRPLVETPELTQTYDASRRSEVVDHAEIDGVEGLLSVLGGKWTTSRHLAERVLDRAEGKLGTSLPPTKTDRTPLPGGTMERHAAFCERMRREHADLDPEVVDNLTQHYGAMIDRVLAHARSDPALLERLGPNVPDVRAQVVHAVREEMACTVADVVFRRTGIGTLGDPGDVVLEAVATTMAAELGWDAGERARQLEQARRGFTPAEASEAVP
jgi:glycerol-3-phosphate dehydrogenase